MSLRSYTQELSRSTNVASSVNEIQLGKIKPNDFNRISKDFRET